MSSSITPLQALTSIANGSSSIDVRAPLEFQRGALPLSKNLPILDDEQRAAVGLCYKSEGPEAAMQMGYKFVQGDLREERISKWLGQLTLDPSALIYCSRGGLRSKIAAEWISDKGHVIRRIEGGFKAVRNKLLSFLAPDPRELLILGGSTGVGKTVVIENDAAAIDLEGYANHRGSAFGAFLDSQPSQIDFENAVALQFFKQARIDSDKRERTQVLLEDEGRMIGRINLPPCLQAAMSGAPLIILEATLEARVSHIFEEYVQKHLDTITSTQALDPFQVLGERLGNSLFSIHKRLGGDRYQAISKQLNSAIKAHKIVDPSGHREWIKALLLDYYDPMYQYQLEQKEHRVVFRGSKEEIIEWRRAKLSILH